jgi:uncharacterized protein (TIGR03083 family)
LTHLDFLGAIEREGLALGRTITRGADRHIAAYPHWTLLDLVAHTGTVHRWVAKLVTSGAVHPLARPGHWDRDPGRLAEWFAEGLALVIDVLRNSDPDRPVWTMAADQTAGFWRRRMAHETATHRWDAEQAIGRPRPIDPAIALTGIPETLEIHVVRPLAGMEVGGKGERIALRTTDVDAEWLVTLRPNWVEFVGGQGQADVTLSGSASSVWLSLMDRPVTDVTAHGDNDCLTRFRAALRMADAPSH